MKKVKMTNNEYREFLKANASKLWNKEVNYSYKDYCKDADNVEIIPFDLTKYNLPIDIEKKINKYFNEEFDNKDGEHVLKGFSELEDQWYLITNELGLKREMGYYYSGYCQNEENNFYMSYCEGDLYLYLFDNKEDYRKSLDNTMKWYEEN